jgi:hypothetical protein
MPEGGGGRLSRNHAVGDGVRPHPNPLPQEREPAVAAPGTVTGWRTFCSVGEASPSPWGEGRGEGERCISTASLRLSAGCRIPNAGWQGSEGGRFPALQRSSAPIRRRSRCRAACFPAEDPAPAAAPQQPCRRRAIISPVTRGAGLRRGPFLRRAGRGRCRRLLLRVRRCRTRGAATRT